MNIKESLILVGLVFNFIGGIILGFSIIKTIGNIYLESLNTFHTCFSEFNDQFIRIKNEVKKYLKENPKSFIWYEELFEKKATEENFEEDNFYLNTFKYISLRKARIIGIWGISLLLIGFVIQISSILYFK